jgi:outer membrane protein
MQRIKTALLFSVLILLTTTIFCQDNSNIGSGLTLKQCVDIAIKNNLLINQSSLQMQQGDIALTQAKANFLPSINGSASHGINEGRSISSANNQYVNATTNAGNYGLNAGLVLFSGLQYQNILKQNQYASEASKLDWQQQKDNITLNVLLAYLQVLSNQDLLTIAKQQTDVDSKQVQRLELQNSEGAIPPSALYDLRGQFANDQVNIINQTNALETARINLFQLMNVPYKRDVEFEKISIDAAFNMYGNSSDTIYQIALQKMPVVKSVELKTKSFEKALSAAKGQYYPTLSFYGSLGTNYSSVASNVYYGPLVDDPNPSTNYVTVGGTKYFLTLQQPSYINTQKISFGDQFRNNVQTSFGLQLQVPILNSLRARNNVKYAKISLANEKLVANSTRLQLQQNVEQAYQNMIAAYGQLKAYQDQVNAYAESFRAAEIKFNNGVITSVDYVIAKNNFDRATANLTAAKYNYIFRTKILDYYQGSLTW